MEFRRRPRSTLADEKPRGDVIGDVHNDVTGCHGNATPAAAANAKAIAT